jgi:toxin ParE1/3/4
MAGGFRRSERSGLDLDEIFAWVAEDNGLSVAIAQMDRLEAGLARIEVHPRIGRVRRDLGENTFTLPVTPWVIIYELVGTDVEVLRVVDGRRDLSAVLEESR